MKIRRDFVSNSSSSSFVLLGNIFDTEDVKKVIKNLGIIDKIEHDSDDDEDTEEDEDIYELMEAFCNHANLSYELEGDYDNENVLIGVEPNSLDDSMTISDAKQEISDKLNSYGLSCSKDDISFVSGGSGPEGYTFFESLG